MTAEERTGGLPGYSAGLGVDPAGGAPGVDWAVKMRIRPPEIETSICDAKYRVSLRLNNRWLTKEIWSFENQIVLVKYGLLNLCLNPVFLAKFSFLDLAGFEN
ncbi:hypothetical protein F511_28412 [Dorcoceras hygrometricum]|uniref:Uncharacterized protein n=1 Tax=Dorcoceras hygrometricum TaxID=472368 RepID=A0A2Z7BTL1_9LAMI|nr:hypothetical protein F511_28412 [Dorcoceras hygrometricum]